MSEDDAAAEEAAQRERLREAEARGQETLERAERLERERERLEEERPVPEDAAR